ncbi:MAG: phosphate acyltransferase PlsX [SAR202 cluster bacterium Io17-Chloro-G4]|nr:MAG: phosphate acyltransferase PlsX [SAR202 cluster bacterium Io17-Chloro-G4]
MSAENDQNGSTVRVVLDAMGGDYGPVETVKGAMRALESGNIEVILVGEKDSVEAELANYDLAGKPVRIVPSEGKIGDDEHPVRAMRSKPDSSILIANKLLKSGEADVLVSMGSTGASMAGAVLALGLLEGLDRPCIGGPFLGLAPRTVLVDMGSNIDCRPGMLLNFAALGMVFSRKFLEIPDPKVGLLSVGAETAKGNKQVQESHQLFADSHLNFVGNVEGMDFFTQKADVIVCDGFVGNILMKYTEGLGSALFPFLERELSSRMAPEDVRSFAASLWQMMNLPRTMGGPLFGVNGAVVLGHGSCKGGEVAGAINTATRYVNLGMVESMREELSKMNRQETPSNPS